MQKPFLVRPILSLFGNPLQNARLKELEIETGTNLAPLSSPSHTRVMKLPDLLEISRFLTRSAHKSKRCRNARKQSFAAHKPDLEELGRNLTLIWAPQKLRNENPLWRMEDGFHFSTRLSPTVDFFFTAYALMTNNPVILHYWFIVEYKAGRRRMSLMYNSYSGDIQATERSRKHFELQQMSKNGTITKRQSQNGTHSEELQKFVGEWLPRFRRCAFLLDFPVECTSHEQLEWHLWFAQRKRIYEHQAPATQ